MESIKQLVESEKAPLLVITHLLEKEQINTWQKNEIFPVVYSMKVLPIKPESMNLKWVKGLGNLPEIKFNSWNAIEVTTHLNKLKPFWNHRKPFLFIIPAKSSWVVEISNQQGKTTYSTNYLYDLVIAIEGNFKITLDKRNDQYPLIIIARK